MAMLTEHAARMAKQHNQAYFDSLEPVRARKPGASERASALTRSGGPPRPQSAALTLSPGEESGDSTSSGKPLAKTVSTDRPAFPGALHYNS